MFFLPILASAMGHASPDPFTGNPELNIEPGGTRLVGWFVLGSWSVWWPPAFSLVLWLWLSLLSESS